MFDCDKKSVALLLLSVCLFQVTVAFECAGGCLVPDSYLSDGYCDCVDCGDEDQYTCDSCTGCPTVCGDYIQCERTFNCSDGCEIDLSKVDDDKCDCSDCVDESAFSCDSCQNGCPKTCGASTLCPNESDSYQCVSVSDLAPWWWVVAATLWHVIKSMYFVFTADTNSKDKQRSNSISGTIQKYMDDKYMALPKVILLFAEVAAYIVVFVLESLRFHRKRTDGLNGWQQYTCFAEIWMFSSNAPRLFAILIACVCFLYANVEKQHSRKQECLVEYSIFPLMFLVVLICPSFVLYIPIFVTHVLPMFVVYCWILVPGVLSLLGFFLLIFFCVMYSSEKKASGNFAEFGGVVMCLLALLCVTVVFMFAVALAFNFYRTGNYLHSLKVVTSERSYNDYISTVPLGSSSLKMVMWLF